MVPLSTKGIRQFCLNQLSTSPMRPLRLKFFFELNVSPAWSKLALTAFTTQAREKEIALQKEWVKILQHQNPLDCYPVIFVLTWINLYCISRSKPVVHLSNRLFGNQLDLHRDPQHNGCQVVLARWRHREDNSTGMQGMTWQLSKMTTQLAATRKSTCPWPLCLNPAVGQVQTRVRIQKYPFTKSGHPQQGASLGNYLMWKMFELHKAF